MPSASLPEHVRRRIEGYRARSARDTARGAPAIREQCPRCRERYPLGVLRGLTPRTPSRLAICPLCRADLVDASREEVLRWR